jgi:hypothetical protein
MTSIGRTVSVCLLILAVFLGAGPLLAMSEAELTRTEALLVKIGQIKDAEFIRNGKAYSPAKGESHLRRKLKSAKNRLNTAEEFIAQAASSSSISGEPYLIRLSDGTEVLARDYFGNLLNSLDK